MPRPSAVLQLPPDVRDALNAELTRRAFSDYTGLAEWLGDKGYEISRSALHRYGSKFEQSLAALRVATEQARAIVEAMPDEEGRMGEALTRLAQEKAFQVLMNLDTEEQDLTLDKLGTMIARLNRTSVAQKQWQQQIDARTQAAAEEVDDLARKAGLSDDTAKAIRAKILGITA